MRILYLCGDPGIDIAGQSGGSIHVRAIARALTRIGHQLVLLYTSGAPGEAERSETDAVFCRAPISRLNRTIAHIVQKCNRLLSRGIRQHPDVVRVLHNLTLARTGLRILRHGTPDFIYERYTLWGVAGVYLARRFGVPLVLEVNAPLVYEQKIYRGLSFPKAARAVERFVWMKASVVIGVSNSLGRELEAAGVLAANILVMPNGVDPESFQAGRDAGDLRERLNLRGRFVVGLVGTFKAWHGTALLLTAFAIVHRGDPSTHLLLVGDGPFRCSLEQQAKELGVEDAVTFTGNVPHEHVAQYISALDVAVLAYPPLDQPYYSPLKLFEYMAAGRAIVATSAGQAAEILSDGYTGLLCEPGDAHGLARCITCLQLNPTLLSRLGRNAREACRHYTWLNNAERITSRVELTLESRKGLSAVSEEDPKLA